MYQSRCTAKNSWWWVERLPETCRVVIPIKLEFSASVGFIYKESVTMHVHTIVKKWEFCLVNKSTEPVISPLPIFYAFFSYRRMVSVGCSYPSPHSARPSATSFGEITWWSLLSATPSYQMVFSIFTAACLSCLFLPSFVWEHLISDVPK